MDDPIKLDLADHDKAYIHDMLNAFLAKAERYGRNLVEIRLSKAMSDKLGIESHARGGSFKGVTVVIAETGFGGTIEVILGHLH